MTVAGHFALTRWLLNMLLQAIPGETTAARVINVASSAYLAGDFHPSITQDDGLGDFSGQITDNCGFTESLHLPCCPALACPLTNGYARAKLANILHIHELQARVDRFASNLTSTDHPLRRLVTASLHPGTVSTNIHPNMRRAGYILRSPQQAARVVLHAVFSHTFLPGAFIDSMQHAHDLEDYRGMHLPQHIAAYPDTSLLPFAHAPSIKPFSFEEYIWRSASKRANASRAELAKTLWEVSDRIVLKWGEDNRTDFDGSVTSDTFCGLA